MFGGEPGCDAAIVERLPRRRAGKMNPPALPLFGCALP
jgi:hypothetical protein